MSILSLRLIASISPLIRSEKVQCSSIHFQINLANMLQAQSLLLLRHQFPGSYSATGVGASPQPTIHLCLPSIQTRHWWQVFMLSPPRTFGLEQTPQMAIGRPATTGLAAHQIPVM